jgi:hypothetical protein
MIEKQHLSYVIAVFVECQFYIIVSCLASLLCLISWRKNTAGAGGAISDNGWSNMGVIRTTYSIVPIINDIVSSNTTIDIPQTLQ